jgi:hypothetical protein
MALILSPFYLTLPANILILTYSITGTLLGTAPGAVVGSFFERPDKK